jgi:hypothetical protein
MPHGSKSVKKQRCLAEQFRDPKDLEDRLVGMLLFVKALPIAHNKENVAYGLGSSFWTPIFFALVRLFG